MGYVHLDIKPDNIVIGKDSDKNKLFLIDYGISERFLTKEGKHRSQRNMDYVYGNLIYMSKNAFNYKS